METIYNVDFGVSNCYPHCPKDLYDKTVELLKEKSLIGIKQVNKYGEMAEGYDRNCRDFRKAFFNVHYRENEERSIPEIIEQYKLTASSEDELAQEAIELGESILEIMAKFDSTIGVTPWNIYSSFPICSSLEIMTPAGRQSLYYHTKDGKDFGIIQLWKPQKENNFYVLDELKRTLGDLSFEEWDISDKLREMRNQFKPIEKIKCMNRSRLLNKASKVYKQFLINPNKVKRFPSFIKHL